MPPAHRGTRASAPLFGALFCLVFSMLDGWAAPPNYQTAWLRDRLHFESLRDASGEEGFRAQSPGYGVELSRRGAHIVTANADGAASMEIRFDGATGPHAIRAEEPLPGVVNRYEGADPSQWRSGIPTFGRVRLKEVYPGIDVVFYGNGLELEYDVEVAPGVATDSVRIEFPGAEVVRIDEEGALVLNVGGVSLRQRAPLVYQVENGKRVTVPSRYRMDECGGASFEIGAYDRGQTLIIDPVVEWSTYFGGTSAVEMINDVTVDTGGNIYVTGQTYMSGSGDLPLQNAMQDHNDEMFRDGNGNLIVSQNAFIASFTPGGQLRFSTYLGGQRAEAGIAIAAGRGLNDGVFVTGWTTSVTGGQFIPTTFPLTPGAYLTNKTEVDSDAIFLTKLTTSGQMVYSTLLFPRNQSGTSYELDVDSEGRAYVGGFVEAGQFPGTGAGGGTIIGTGAFLLAVNPEGSGLIYGNHIGFLGRTLAVAVETNGVAHAGGFLGGSGDGFQSTPNAFDSDRPTSGSGFYQKVAPDGAIIYATRLGSLVEDAALAADGTVLLAGGESMLTKFDPSKPGREALVMTNDFGGSGLDVIKAIDVDNAGNIFIAGYTDSIDLPTVSPTQTNYAGGNDVFVAQLNAPATGIVFLTYLGGTNDEPINGAASTLFYRISLGIAADPWGRFFVVAGGTTSTDFPLAQPFQNSIKGSTSGFITKYIPGVANNTFIVNNVNDVDDGNCDTAHCSLREAIHAANEIPGHQTITFEIPGPAPHTIRPLSRLPIINEAVTIDGTKQVDGRWPIVLDGSAFSGEGFRVYGGGTTLRELVIHSFDTAAIHLREKGGNTVVDCVIGLNQSRQEAPGNIGAGIFLDSSPNNVIGDGFDFNIICANTTGIRIFGWESIGNQVGGNFVGVNVQQQAFGNSAHGISVELASKNRIGGDGLLIIGGNDQNGIRIFGGAASNNIVIGSYIGVGVEENPLPNKRNGIEIDGSSGNVIGGTGFLDGNVISGNLKSGILITNAANNMIHGNRIGVGHTDIPVSNGEDGITLNNATRTVIGGPSGRPGYRPGNVISANLRDGIRSDYASSGTIIEGNVIGTDSVTGTEALGNQVGIRSYEGKTRIGGPNVSQRNLIAGNTEGGIYTYGQGAIIQGNWIGINFAGGANANGGFLAPPRDVYIEASETLLGGELIAGKTFGEPPGNVIGEAVEIQFGNLVKVLGNSLGTDPAGNTRLGPGRINASGHAIHIGSAPAGSNRIAGGISLRGPRSVVRANTVGINSSDAQFQNTGPMILLGDAEDAIIGGRQQADGNKITGGSFGVSLDLPSTRRRGNAILGNEIRRFSESAISTNSAASDRVARPSIVSFVPIGGAAMAHVTFEPLADGEAGEIEIFLANVGANGEAEPFLLETRALVSAEGSRSNVFVHVDSFGPIAASLTKFGKSTSPLALPVGLQTFPPDADFDSVPDEIENAGGGNGDGDKDGTPDSQQNGVITAPAGVNFDWLTVRMASPGLLTAAVPKDDLPRPNMPETPFQFTLGLDYAFSYRVDIGASLDLEMFLTPGLKANGWLTYGKTVADPTLKWSLFTFDGATGAEFLADKAVLHLVDGGRGDGDAAENGRIELTGNFVWLAEQPPLEIAELSPLPGEDLLMRFSAGMNVPYQIQESADLWAWETIMSWQAQASSAEPTVILPSNPGANRFFRIHTSPPPPP